MATVLSTWVWQILSPQAGSWWGLGLSPTFRNHWRSISALEALSVVDDITLLVVDRHKLTVFYLNIIATGSMQFRNVRDVLKEEYTNILPVS